SRIFPYNTTQQMLNVHLYFVKLFGCHIVDAGIPIDVGTFANAILLGKAHPDVYLQCGCDRMFNGAAMTGMSDIHVENRTSDGSCAFVTWSYFVQGLGVNVMFATQAERRQGLIGAWHPRSGTNRLLMADFG